MNDGWIVARSATPYDAGMRLNGTRLLVLALCLSAAAPVGTNRAATPTQAAVLEPAMNQAASTVDASRADTSVRTRRPRPSPQRDATTVASAPTAAAIVPGSNNRASVYMLATYAVTATIAVATGRITVATTIVAKNDSGSAVDRIELNTIAARLGAIAVTSASVDGKPVTVSVKDQTIVVPLGGLLPAGATTELRITYRATLRTGRGGSDWMFTRYGGTLALYRWIPWISRATPFDRPNHGDPFVTGSSSKVTVRVNADQSMVLAGPGGTIPTAPARTWLFEVTNVRDVSIVLAKDFTVTRRTAGSVAVVAYSRPGGVSGSALADQARLALLREAPRVGVAYPWTSYTVVETAGGYGLEAPSMIWIPSTTLSGNLAYIVHHETAHQWFYGLVGNDQQRQPFADEAVADLLARTVLGSLRSSRCPYATLDRAITAYTAACYYEKIYIQGGLVLNDFRVKMGTTRFWTAVKGYIQANRNRLAGSRQLLEALRVASPVDLGPTLRARFPSLY